MLQRRFKNFTVAFLIVALVVLGMLTSCATEEGTPEASLDTDTNSDTDTLVNDADTNLNTDTIVNDADTNPDTDTVVNDADTTDIDVDIDVDVDTGPPSYFASHLPKNPAEAFDLDAIKNAQLSTLLWRQTETSVVDGVRIVDGTFSPGTYTGPLADGSGIKTIVMKSRIRVYYPENSSTALPILVYAAHIEAAVENKDIQVIYQNMAKTLNMAVVVHGEMPSDGNALGYATDSQPRDLLVNDSMSYVMQTNGCTAVDLITGNFPYALAKTNMLALTLGHRILEAAGKDVGKAALWGASKEGFATWICSAVDDRLIVAAPSYFQRLDVESLNMYEINAGCDPDKYSKSVDVPSMLTMRDWFRDSPGGIAASHFMMVPFFASQIIPKALIINTDIGMWWLHEGQFFTLAADTHFLDNFTSVPFRTERFFEETKGSSTEPKLRFELFKLAYLLTRDNPSTALQDWPTIESATATDSGTEINIQVKVSNDPDIGHVRIHWALSPNRAYNDPNQQSWNTLELLKTGDANVWQAVVSAPSGLGQIAWYAEVEEIVDFAGLHVPRRDTTPIRFLRELPEMSCPTCSTNQTPPNCYEPFTCP